MLIGIISDTHDHVPHIQKAVHIFKKRKAELVIHAGDFCSPFTIPHFKGLNMQGIFGNNDGDKFLLMAKFQEIGAGLNGDFMQLEMDGTHIAVYHGTYGEITRSLIESGRYDVVISGHTHQRVHEVVGNTTVINPGTAHGFGDTATIAFLDTESAKVEFVTLN